MRILPVAGIALALALTAVWGAFLGFELFSVAKFLF
jgi:hypothetical protein